MRFRPRRRTLRCMFSPMLTKLMIDASADEARRAAAGAAQKRARLAALAPDAEAADVTITIRPAMPADAAALAMLAKLDSAPLPAGPLLLAETNGQLRAAVALCDRAALANPFHPTAAIVQLLLARAEQLCGEPRRRRSLTRVLGAWSARRRWRTAATRPV
jgi:hypothetical protein